MATSSITKNFIISGEKQVEMFADAVEASADDEHLVFQSMLPICKEQMKY